MSDFFYVVDEYLWTSPQPNIELLKALHQYDIQHVINLATSTSDHAVPEEGFLIIDQQINYIHLPVVWESPSAQQFNLFCQLLWPLREDKVLVHCACNMRATTFVFLYRVLHEGADLSESLAWLHAIWRPSGVWREFLLEQLWTHDFIVEPSEVGDDDAP